MKSLIDLDLSHEEFVSLSNVLKEYNEMKNKIENPETCVKYVT